MKVGDYVRTIKGKIYKLTENDLKFEITKQNCKISSLNIIDLIQEGDYVNGHRVTNISKEQGKIIEIYLDTNDLFEQDIYKKEDIKSIVTREMFESMEYKVEK